MKPSPSIALAVAAGIVAAALSTTGCSQTSSHTPTTLSLSAPAMSSHSAGPTLSAPNSTPPTASAAGPMPTAVQQLCDPQPWPRLGTRRCRTAPPAFRPCDWVTTTEAARILGAPVTAEPREEEAGSVDMSCDYSEGIGFGFVESDLRVPGAFPVDAASQFAFATAEEGTTTPVDGLGVKAKCVIEQRTTPPSTTLLILLNGDRLYRAVGGYVYCDTLKQFAQVAIGRIGA